MTPDEIGQIYDQGRDAVLDLVNGLLVAVAHLQQQNEQLLTRVSHLEARLAKDSHNSGKPSGAQKGHPGSSLCWSQTPDQVGGHRPEQCRLCGEPLTQIPGRECRQVHGLPPLSIQVSEHQVYSGCCAVCQQTASSCPFVPSAARSAWRLS